MDGVNTYSRDVLDEKFKGVDEKFEVSNHRVKDLEEEIKDIKDLTLAITKVNDKVDNLSTNMNLKVDNIEKNVGEMKNDLKCITAKPIEFIEKIKVSAITTVVVGIIGAILALIIK